MSWTYSGDPSSSTRDAVRFLIQDTSTAAHQFSDEELNWIITQNGDNAYRAAIAATETLVAQYSRKADKSVGDLSISYSQIAGQYRSLLKDLRTRTAIETFTPWAGGISLSDKQSYESDSDRNPGSFKIGMHDYDGTPTNRSDEEN